MARCGQGDATAMVGGHQWTFGLARNSEGARRRPHVVAEDQRRTYSTVAVSSFSGSAKGFYRQQAAFHAHRHPPAVYNDQFRILAEPFLVVGDIENGVRRMVHGKFTVKELEEAKAPGEDGRSIEGPADLTFGEYIRLVELEKRWKKLRLEIDRVEFVSRLNRVREIRNDVMHFDPDGLAPEDMLFLREFAQFLKRLRDVGVV